MAPLENLPFIYFFLFKVINLRSTDDTKRFI